MDESVVKHLEQPQLDEASLLLLKAADLLNAGKWYPGEGKEDAQCAWGAIVTAEGRGEYWAHDAAFAAGSRLASHLGFGYISGIFRWNDAQTSKTVVISTMRRVALGG